MASRTFKVSANKDTAPVEFSKNFGSNLTEMRELFDDAVIFEMAQDNMVIALQSKIRAMMTGANRDKRVYNKDEIANMVETWKPTLRANMDPTKKIAAVKTGLASLPEAERNAIIASYMAELAKTQAPAPQPAPEKNLRKGSKKAA